MPSWPQFECALVRRIGVFVFQGAVFVDPDATCTGAVEDVHGYFAGWVECGFCEFRHMAVMPTCTLAFCDGSIECPRCRRPRGKFISWVQAESRVS